MDIWKYLASVQKPIVLYGMGNGADKIIEKLYDINRSVSGVFVSDGFVRNKLFHGLPLMGYSEAKAKFGDMTVLVSFGSSLPDVMENIIRISCEQELFAPYIPVVEGGSFTDEYYKQNEHKFNYVAKRFADEFSCSVYENLIQYRLSGKITHLCGYESTADDILNLLSLGKDEVYIDLGAYTGDTVLQFANHVGKYSHIYAVEPDVKTFKKLEKNTQSMKNITLINKAIGEKEGVVSFSMQGGRSSAVAEKDVKRCTEIPCVSVDEILQGGSASYIKFDVEGQECEAIRGCKNTILNYKPKLAVSCYHRIDDLFKIVDEVFSIRSDYKLYIRRLPYIPDWDTMFLFV